MENEERMMYRLVAEVLAAAGHEIRLAILYFLRDGEKCVCDIAEHVAAKRSNISRHLAVLLRFGLVEQRREGLKVMYSLRAPCILGLTDCVAGVLRKRACDCRAILENLDRETAGRKC